MKKLTEGQFHTVWTEAVGMEGYNKKLFQNLLKSLQDKGLISDDTCLKPNQHPYQLHPYKFKKPTRVLCKRTSKCGENFYWDESVFPKVKRKFDNRMLVKGHWYDVVYNENDTDETFSIKDNQGNLELFWMYENEDNHKLSRTYSKWFYTPSELQTKKIMEAIKKLNDDNVI
jgi:hypothetical protein